jgi:hypothetical protein
LKAVNARFPSGVGYPAFIQAICFFRFAFRFSAKKHASALREKHLLISMIHSFCLMLMNQLLANACSLFGNGKT